jgi:hypothetical protein
MKDNLAIIRDLLIIAAVFLYFIAKVYVHYYYGMFGLPTQSLNIDYSTYLVFSYNVVSSEPFLWLLACFTALYVDIRILIIAIVLCTHKYSRLSWLNSWLNAGKDIVSKHKFLLLGMIVLAIFPCLFNCAEAVAIDHNISDRKNVDHFRSIQFLFRKDAEWLNPITTLEALEAKDSLSAEDVQILRQDSAPVLRLLGESDDYYFVLHQGPFDNDLQALPQGYVYSVNKKDVLLAKIILRSTQ